MAAAGSRNDPFASFNFIVDDREHAGRLLAKSAASPPRPTSSSTARAPRTSPCARSRASASTPTSASSAASPDGKELWEWRKKVHGRQDPAPAAARSRCSTKRASRRSRWEFSEGWPSKWAGPAINAKNNEVAIEEMEIAVEGLALET